MFYTKKTYQPNIINTINTSIKGDSLQYNNTNIKINRSDKNIFTILYLLQTNNFDELKKINVVEREGKYYNFSFDEEDENIFTLLIDEQNSDCNGAIKDTDIFLWGLFLDESFNQIIIDDSHLYIQKCKFKKGLITITAKYIK